MEISRIALTGMERAEGQLRQTADRLARVGSIEAADEVHFSAKMVALMHARTAFAASARAARTGDEIEKIAIDLLG